MIQVDIFNLVGNILGPLIVGLIIWRLGEKAIDRRNQNEAIRDLMTFRGDYASPEFRRSLNKISITFHKDTETRKEIRDLYEVINNPSSLESNINRKIVGLIYNLCKKNGFEGITEYDIDQAFPESKQSPTISLSDVTVIKNTQRENHKTKKNSSQNSKKQERHV